jgi:DNA-binding IclR family transcriptional regulator
MLRNNGPQGGTTPKGPGARASSMARKSTGKTAPRASRARLSSVATAIRLLKAFSEDEVEIGISALARRLSLAKSTVHRLAVTLVSEGLLEQDRDSSKYQLGIALFRLGALVRRRMNVSNEARPYLYDLRETVNESVHLAILDETEIMYVYNLESTHAIRMRSDIGVRKPAYCTAEGQAILAFAPDDVVARMIAAGLTARTPKTITSPEKFGKELALTRQRGCAIEDEESELGMVSIAAPIRDDSGEVVAAVGIAGPVTRLTKKSIAAFVPHVIATADQVSTRLGYRGR